MNCADSLTRDAATPYLKARRIEQHLRTQYQFDLEAPDAPPRADGVGNFLLNSKRGYFDQYASAMVVMLRASGVPARMAVGFVLDPPQTSGIRRRSCTRSPTARPGRGRRCT